MESDSNVNGNLNDNSVLDTLASTGNQRKSGTAKAVIFILIVVAILFVPITVRGSTNVTFGIVYKNTEAGLGLVGFWTGGLIIIGNGLASVYGEYLRKNKDSAAYRCYQEDSVLHPLFYLLSSILVPILVLHYIFPVFEGPAAVVSPGIGKTVYSIAMSVAQIVPISAVFMPFLLSYGVVDFAESLMEPLIRPVFKIPGRSAINVIASFVSSVSVGVLTISKLYQRGIYTEKETALIATGFSVVSVGSACKMIETADLSGCFLSTYFIVPPVTLIAGFFVTRTPPLSRKVSMSADGRRQIKEEIQVERVPARVVLKAGTSRAVKKTATAPGLFEEIWSSLLDNRYVLPKVISLLTTVGIITMLAAAYTSVFSQIGKLFAPLLVLLQAPNTTEIALTLSIGIAEMFPPALIIADKVGTLAVGARYIVVTVPVVQIIFFSETIVVMISTKIPVSSKELIIRFFERTIVAIPISALFAHLLF